MDEFKALVKCLHAGYKVFYEYMYGYFSVSKVILKRELYRIELILDFYLT